MPDESVYEIYFAGLHHPSDIHAGLVFQPLGQPPSLVLSLFSARGAEDGSMFFYSPISRPGAIRVVGDFGIPNDAVSSLKAL